MNKKLLVDVRPFEISRQKIDESIKENDGRLIVKGVLQRAESKNQNGRVYPREVLLKEVSKYLEEQVSERRALGELDHPDDSVINLKNASHLVTDIWWDQGAVMGKIQVLNTPSGQVLKELVGAGVKLGISSRGLGSVKESMGETIVEDDFQLICWDFVSEPSTPGAFMMKEGVEVSRSDLRKHFNKSDRIDRIFNEIIDWNGDK